MEKIKIIDKVAAKKYDKIKTILLKIEEQKNKYKNEEIKLEQLKNIIYQKYFDLNCEKDKFNLFFDRLTDYKNRNLIYFFKTCEQFFDYEKFIFEQKIEQLKTNLKKQIKLKQKYYKKLLGE